MNFSDQLCVKNLFPHWENTISPTFKFSIADYINRGLPALQRVFFTSRRALMIALWRLLKLVCIVANVVSFGAVDTGLSKSSIPSYFSLRANRQAE
jgi:hypothetical protein